MKAILTADFHLREDQPDCRSDNFENSQWKKVDFIRELQIKYDCIVLHAGDLFHHWKPSPSLLSKTIEHLPNQFCTVYGNHDLPQHSLQLAKKCGIYTLKKAGKINLLRYYHSGTHPNKENYEGSLMIEDLKICVWHVMTYKNILPYPGCVESNAFSLLKKYDDFDLIVTGDNHKPFVVHYEGRLLVNPGSLTRQKANELHEPRVYVWDSETNSVKRIFLPFKKDVISRKHIEIVEKRNARIDAFISKLDEDWEVSLSFEDNLKKFEKQNKVEKPIMEIIYKAISS